LVAAGLIAVADASGFGALAIRVAFDTIGFGGLTLPLA
jgi:hypothetical protein